MDGVEPEADSVPDQPENTGRNPDGTFAPGNSINPAGKPKGALHKTTKAALELMEGDMEVVTRKCIDEAKAGNMTAMKLVLDRIVPQSRSRRIQLDLPPIETAADCLKAQGVITAAMAAGDLSPDEAETAANVVEMRRRAIETVEHEKRIEAMEKEKGSYVVTSNIERRLKRLEGPAWGRISGVHDRGDGMRSDEERLRMLGILDKPGREFSVISLYSGTGPATGR